MTRIYHDVALLEQAHSNAQADLKVHQAQAERDIIAQSNGDYGKNDKERDRYLLCKLAEHQGYQAALKNARQIEAQLREAKADLELYKDIQRQDRWAVRAQMVAVLNRRGLPVEPADGLFDRAMDEETWDASQYAAQNGYDPADDPEAYADDAWPQGSENGYPFS